MGGGEAMRGVAPGGTHTLLLILMLLSHLDFRFAIVGTDVNSLFLCFVWWFVISQVLHRDRYEN